VARLRKVMVEAQAALAEAELEDVDMQDGITKLDNISSWMLQREMLALGVMEPLDDDQGMALAKPGFAWAEAPSVKLID
jgi:hypothetical protein